MKKYISKFLTLAFAAFGTFSFLLFSSCDGVIFHTIRDEVELADAKLSGDIQNIVRYKDEIFASTGEIYHRDTSDTKKDWASFTNPSSKYVFSLAADSDNLYALSVSLEEDDDGYNVAKSRTLFNKRPAILGVPRERLAISLAPSSAILIPKSSAFLMIMIFNSFSV